jgi:DNA-binding NtrC family response regulator
MEIKNPYLSDVAIVIVDDEPDIASLLKDIVKDIVRNVHAFTSGREALEHVRNHDADIMVLDINMPEIDGITLLREIRRIKPQTAIIVYSGCFNNENMRVMIQNEAFDILVKPADIDDFRMTIRRCIEKVKTDRILNEILETLMYATSSKLKPEDFMKLSAAEKSKVLAAMLGVLRSKIANKKLGGIAS